MLSLLPQLYCEEKNSCKSPVIDSYFYFRLVDKYGMNQIAAWGTRYLSDSTYFTKLDGSMPRQLEILGDGNISFVIPEDDYEALDTQATQVFLLYLPDVQGHPRDDVDTFTFKYKFQGACFEEFIVYYNDSLYHQGEYEKFLLFTKH